jgi:hypothetical protein
VIPSTPAASLDQPFELLAGCHDRVRRSLALLQRLVEHVRAHGADAQARSAADDVLRYFDIAGEPRDGGASRRQVHRMSSARKSLTLVKVGPGTTRSPSGAKKL